jgi:hypothetical protein
MSLLRKSWWNDPMDRRPVLVSPAKDVSLFPVCANLSCSSSWLHLWRNRRTPVFEKGWTCSEVCTRARIEAAVAREMDGQERKSIEHRHRIPLGLVMLAQGWISQAQLKSALAAQRAAGSGRIGSWLVEVSNIPEYLVTRALSLQWNCPIFSMETPPLLAMGAIAPRLLLEAFGILPIRVAGRKLLYVGFEDRIDRCVTFALERMTGLRVEAGLVTTSEFTRAHRELLEGSSFPKTRLLEAVDQQAMTQAFTQIVERTRPCDAQLVRVHDCFWLRMWQKPPSQIAPLEHCGIEDVVCTIGRAIQA